MFSPCFKITTKNKFKVALVTFFVTMEGFQEEVVFGLQHPSFLQMQPIAFIEQLTPMSCKITCQSCRNPSLGLATKAKAYKGRGPRGA
jgi:hypothetical protein